MRNAFLNRELRGIAFLISLFTFAYKLLVLAFCYKTIFRNFPLGPAVYILLYSTGIATMISAISKSDDLSKVLSYATNCVIIVCLIGDALLLFGSCMLRMADSWIASGIHPMVSIALLTGNFLILQEVSENEKRAEYYAKQQMMNNDVSADESVLSDGASEDK